MSKDDLLGQSPEPVGRVSNAGAAPWFLSVCYYENESTDPGELGNPIPQGLFQETGYCFDVEADDPELLGYLRDRLAEAHARALISIES